MKTNELMKDDWVQHTTESGGTIAGKVIAFEGDVVRIDVRVEKGTKTVYPEFTGVDDDFEGVELTPEIMEKNGFKRTGQYWDYYFESDKMCKVFSIALNDGNDDGKHIWNAYAFGVLCWVKYVHELQHIFRICGIRNEILI